MNDKEIEQEIQAKGKTAPRVTPDHIESIIASEHFFTAAQGYDKSAADNFHDDPYPLATPDALHLLSPAKAPAPAQKTSTDRPRQRRAKNLDAGRLSAQTETARRQMTTARIRGLFYAYGS